MELALAIRTLRRRPALLVVGVLIAALVALLSVYRVESGGLKAKSLEYSAGTTQVLVDSKSSLFGSVSQPFEPLAVRAQVYASFMVSPTFLDAVGRKVGLSGNQIYAAGPVRTNAPRLELEPTALKRNVEVTGETKPYRLDFENQLGLPTITINSQAPNTNQAVGLANAAAVSLQDYVASVGSQGDIPKRLNVVIRRLGPATGEVVNGGISKTLAAMVFVAVFVLWCILLLYAQQFRARWRESAEQPEEQMERQNQDAAHDETWGFASTEEANSGNGHDADRAPSHAPPEPERDSRAPRATPGLPWVGRSR